MIVALCEVNVMKLPFYQVILGKFVIENKSPDGDSVRFIADDLELYEYLHRSERINLSSDNSVQLRFQAIDAPELHYGSAEQPFGAESRDALMKLLGFKKIQYSGKKVTSAKPEAIRGAILSTAVERNGRPVAYTLLEKDAADLTDGDSIALDNTLMAKTLNYKLLEQGAAYLNLYSSIPLVHRRLLQEVTGQARRAKLGIWAIDQTSRFVLEDLDSISATDGQLIYPKLFRRSVDYLKAVSKGFNGNLKAWLLASEATPDSENDLVLLNGKTQLKLSDLIIQENNRIIVQANTIELVFIER
jgi:endonuclease YncB( thermonuclease family)